MLTFDDLTPEQRAAIEFMDDGEDSLLAADVGTGKTVMAATSAAHALVEGAVTRWLLLAPLLTATDTWAKEFSRWAHLKHLKVAIACGNKAQRVAALDSDAQIIVMNYENLQWLLNMFPTRPKHPDPLPFDGLICDEIDKLKDVSSKRFKALRNRIGIFNKRIGLTGTLIPNDLLELWGQVYMVDGGQSFGRSFYKWRQQFFYPIDFKQYNWKPFPATRDALLAEIQDITFRVKAKGLPEVVIREPDWIALPETVRNDYYHLEHNFYLELDKDKEVNVANAAVMVGKLQQICAGFNYLDASKEIYWHSLHKYTHWLPDLIRSLGHKQLLIVYHFRAELEVLKKYFPHIPVIGGGTSNARARKLIQEWNAGTIKHMAVHPASAGHGLNLQLNNAHNIAFLTLPWSGGLFHQVVGRLARRGNQAPRVHVYTCLFSGTIDEVVFRTLAGKITRLNDFLDALETRTGTRN